MTKQAILVRYAKELASRGERPAHERIREMLVALGRGYRTSSTEISMALRSSHKHGSIERYPNGRRVEVGGTIYRGVRAAARAEGCSPGAVQKRIKAGRAGWRYLD
jgi:hypothetical protein